MAAVNDYCTNPSSLITDDQFPVAAVSVTSDQFELFSVGLVEDKQEPFSSDQLFSYFPFKSAASII